MKNDIAELQRGYKQMKKEIADLNEKHEKHDELVRMYDFLLQFHDIAKWKFTKDEEIADLQVKHKTLLEDYHRTTDETYKWQSESMKREQTSSFGVCHVCLFRDPLTIGHEKICPYYDEEK
jgi:hypothetical protein